MYISCNNVTVFIIICNSYFMSLTWGTNHALMVPFNIILLFARYLLQFRIINSFIPLLHGCISGIIATRIRKYYYDYITAVYLVNRSLFFTLYAFQNVKLKLILATVILVHFIGYHGYTHPNKNKLISFK